MTRHKQPLSDGGWEVLKLLLMGPLQGERELAYLLRHQPKSLNRLMVRLLALGLVGAITPPYVGRPRRLFYLTRAGLAVLADTTEAADLAAFARRWRVDVASLAQVLLRLPVITTLQTMLDPLITAIHAGIAQTYAPAGFLTHGWYWVRSYQATVRVPRGRETPAAISRCERTVSWS